MRFLAKIRNTRKTGCPASSGIKPSVFIPVPQSSEPGKKFLLYSSYLDVQEHCFMWLQ